MLNTAILLAVLAAGGAAQSRDPGIELGATRFFQPSSGETHVVAMAGVPYIFASQIGDGGEAHIAYRVAVRITDDRGNVLTDESFDRSAPALARRPGAVGVENFRFLLKPGKFMMTVTARDSLTGRVLADSIALVAFTGAPQVSDLMLANEMRIMVPGDTTSLPGEIARGNLRIRTAPVVRVDIVNSNMAYLLEAYSAQETEGALQLSIRKRDGVTVVADLPQIKQQIPAGGGLFKGQFSVEGLPDGDYTMLATLVVNGKPSVTKTEFIVSPAEEALARSMQISEANRGTDAGYFGSLPDDSLDAAAEVLILTGAPSRDLNIYKQDMSLQAKRNFLIDFWAARDNNKRTPINEDRIAFYQAVANVNQLYGERGRVGWKTDRGRIHVRFGAPSEVLQQPSSGRAPPYEVWRYTKGKPIWFIFADPSNQGNFFLMKSNELKEPGRPGYLEILTIEVADEVGRWLGVNLENVP